MSPDQGTVFGLLPSRIRRRQNAAGCRSGTVGSATCARSIPPKLAGNGLHVGFTLRRINIEGGGTSGGTAFIDSSLVGGITGNLAPTTTRAVTGPPGFVDAAAGNFRPRNDLPLLNRGLGVPNFYGYNNFDLDGGARVRTGVLDVGAYENLAFVFANGFEGN